MGSIIKNNRKIFTSPGGDQTSSSSVSIYKQTFIYNGIALILTHTCTTMLSLNWDNLALNEGVDYSVSGTTLTILNSNINNGDLLYAIYE